ncbi:hypothetical protein GBAR_LOCUS25050 [Geodia barretti]|uniref:Uncharacterized protein n=1 Tax=Geodia barretti TaxID=519541 RepID=A0AA35TCW2_GEOBA|nr:hypothetical protein GBAR_LOCUS25050 [Geodia barretti]
MLAGARFQQLLMDSSRTALEPVVFNGIDVGEYFDYAVTSLCVALGVSYVAASSYGHTAVVDCYPPPLLPRDGPCWACNNSPRDRDILSQLTPTHITQISSLSFLPEDKTCGQEGQKLKTSDYFYTRHMEHCHHEPQVNLEDRGLLCLPGLLSSLWVQALRLDHLVRLSLSVAQ